jgi:hypothetical protein
MQTHKLRTAARFTGVVVIVMVLAGGITFAALESGQSKFTGNTIKTGSAHLLVGTDGTNFAVSQAGFSFDGLVPGGPAQPADGYAFYLKNSGNVALSLKFSVNGQPLNPDNVDLTKVKVIVASTASPLGQPQQFTLADLIAVDTTGGLDLMPSLHIYPGNKMAFTIKVSMDADAISGSGATLSNIDFAFNGVATS